MAGEKALRGFLFLPHHVTMVIIRKNEKKGAVTQLTFSPLFRLQGYGFLQIMRIMNSPDLGSVNPLYTFNFSIGAFSSVFKYSESFLRLEAKHSLAYILPYLLLFHGPPPSLSHTLSIAKLIGRIHGPFTPKCTHTLVSAFCPLLIMSPGT